MGTMKILRNTGLLAASGVVALALAAVPAAPGLDAGFFDFKAAQAKGSGASANGGGNGNSGNAGNNGHGGGHGGGVANAGAGIHSNGNGVSTESHGLGAEGHGLTASSLEGLNAGHASIQGFAHANETSMVGQIGLAVQAAYEGSETDGTISTIDPDEIDDVAFAQALAGILGVEDPVANPASTDVVDAVKGLVDDKVEVSE